MGKWKRAWRINAWMAVLFLGAGAALALPQPSHIVIVVEENQAATLLNTNSPCPYLYSLANDPTYGAYMADYYAITHPSEPNYCAIFSGTTEGLGGDDCPKKYANANMAAGLTGLGFTFMAYSESIPSAGSTVCTGGPIDAKGHPSYARKHCPWVNWQQTGGFPATLSQPFTSYQALPSYSDLPTVSWVIANLQDEMHDGTPAQADAWLRNNMSGYVTFCQNPANNSLLVVTWDEDDDHHHNHIPTLFYGAPVCPKPISAGGYTETVNHYNLLSTILAMYRIPATGFQHAATAAPLTDVFACGTQVPTATPAQSPGWTPTPTPSPTVTPR